MGTRVVAFGGSAVTVEWRDPSLETVVHFVFRATPERSDVAPHRTFCLDRDGRGCFTLTRDGTPIYATGSLPDLAEALMGQVCHHLADRSQGGLLFHAAGLSHGGRGVLMPGGIGAGKSTLTAWLAARGLTYLTDELVFIRHGSTSMQTLIRPLNLKKPSRAALRGALDVESLGKQVWCGTGADLVSPMLIGAPSGPLELPLELILAPRFRHDGPYSFRRLSGGQAGLALIECLINARNLPDHGFAEAARLARSVRAYRIEYASFAQIEADIDALLPHLAHPR